MITPIKRIGLVLSLAACSLAPVSAFAESCAAALERIQRSIGEGGFTETLQEVRKHRRPTVEILGSMTGLHGGRRFLVRRYGKTWGSIHTSVDYDPQGDPRWFIETLGKDAAAFFGFELITDAEMTVPDQSEFAAALRKVNRELARLGKEPINIQFYQWTNENVSVSKYNRIFADTGGIPVALSGNHFLHDMSFHTAAIYLPAYLVRYARLHADYRLQFAQFLRERYSGADPAIQDAVKYYIYRLNFVLTTDIDNFTGVVSTGISEYLSQPRKSDEEPDNNIDYIVYRIVGGTVSYNGTYDDGKVHSPSVYLRDAINEELYHGNWYPTSEKRKLKKHNRVLPPRFIRELVDEFTDNHYRNPDPFFDPRKPYRVGLKQACLDMTLKRENIRAVALHLMGRQELE